MSSHVICTKWMQILSSWNITYELPLLLNKYNLDEKSDLPSTFLRILLNVLEDHI